MAGFDFWNVDEKVSDWLRKEINQWATDMVNGGIDLISDVITSPIDLSEKVPNFEPHHGRHSSHCRHDVSPISLSKSFRCDV